MMAPENMGGFVHHMEKVEGHKIRERSDSFKDYFSQAKLFFDSQSKAEKRHILEAFHFELGKVEDKSIRQRMVYMLANVDRELAADVARGIGVDPPIDEVMIKEVAKDALPPQQGKRSVNQSPALSISNTKKDSIQGRKVAVLLDNGFDYEAFLAVKEKLEGGKATIEIVSKYQGEIVASNGQSVQTDKSHITTASVLYDAIFIPGGEKSIEAMSKQGDVLHYINEVYKHCKPIALQGDAIQLLNHSALRNIENLINDSEKVNVTMGVITTRDQGYLDNFANSFAQCIAMHRFWEREENGKDMIPA